MLIKKALAFISMFVALVVAPIPSLAQKPVVPSVIKMVVPFAPGGGTDIFGRKLAQLLAARLGVTVVIENKPGAGTLVGATLVAKSRPDGATLLFTSTSVLGGAATNRGTNFNPTTELIPVGFVSDGPMLVCVSAASGIKTPGELIAAARANPMKLNVGTPGSGSFGHLSSVALNDAAKTQMTHVGYQGTGPVVMDMIAGRIDMTIGTYTAVTAGLATGKVIPIAVTTAKASAGFPALPPMATAAPGYDLSLWQGVFAPVGTPRALVLHLNRVIREISESPDMAELMNADHASAVPEGPDELLQRVRKDFEALKRVAALAGS